MDIFAFFDFLDQLLSRTPYATEILLGLTLLSVLFLFLAVREFTYRYLKLHLLRQDLRVLSEEVKGLKLQLSDLKSARFDATATMPKDLEFVETATTKSTSQKPVKHLLGISTNENTPTDRPTQKPVARPLQAKSLPPKFPLS